MDKLEMLPAGIRDTSRAGQIEIIDQKLSAFSL
jgi:hypothetical protein